MAKKYPKRQHENPDTATFCGDCGTQLPSLEDVEDSSKLKVHF